MGIHGMWQLLKSEGLIETVDGERLAKQLDGQIIAVDVASWLVQAMTEDSWQHDKKYLRVAFERISHWLRIGVLPVFVLDGPPPLQKAEERRRRYQIRSGLKFSLEEWQRFLTRNPSRRRLDWMNRDIEILCHLLGIPCIQAQGEAEQLCAKLNEAGFCDGVASEDTDSLLFGARKVYRGLRLHTELQSLQHSAQIVDMTLVKERFPKPIILALALLCGSDFLVDGVEGIGGKKALQVLGILQSRLVQAGKSGGDHMLLDLLREVMASPRCVVDQQGRCRTCVYCRHGGTRRERHGKQGCVQCETQYKSRGGSGAGGCMPWQDALSGAKATGCPCQGCSVQEERVLQALTSRVHAAGKESYLTRFDFARAAYEAADRDTLAMLDRELKVEEGPFRWIKQPDFWGLRELLKTVYGHSGHGRQNISRKLLPLLLEYDLRSATNCMGRIGEGPQPEAVLRSAQDYGILFLPVKIDRLSGTGGAMEWRYILHYEPTCEAAKQLLREAAEESESRSTQREAKVPSIQHILSAEKRAARRSLIDAKFPDLVNRFEQRKERPLQRPKKAPAKRPPADHLPSVKLSHYFKPLRGQADEKKASRAAHETLFAASTEMVPQEHLQVQASKAVEPIATVDLVSEEQADSPPGASAVAASESLPGTPPCCKEAACTPSAPRKSRRPSAGQLVMEDHMCVRNLGKALKRARSSGRVSAFRPDAVSFVKSRGASTSEDPRGTETESRPAIVEAAAIATHVSISSHGGEKGGDGCAIECVLTDNDLTKGDLCSQQANLIDLTSEAAQAARCSIAR